ncbi:MAG: DUF881 domain-containing protein [Clostridiaceae bacterium]
MFKNEGKIFIFIACIAIGTLITSNLDNSSGQYKILTAAQYQEALNEKNKLNNEINALSLQYGEFSNKLSNYDNEYKDEYLVAQDMEEELGYNNYLLGLTKVSGPGIEIILDDATSEFFQINSIYNLIHDQDMIQVINDLRNAGAESIAINGIRVIDMSEIYCGGPFLRLNGIYIPAPFHITAIGDKDILKTYMLSDDKYLKWLKTRNISVIVNTYDNIEIPKYNGTINHEFMNILEIP